MKVTKQTIVYVKFYLFIFIIKFVSCYVNLEMAKCTKAKDKLNKDYNTLSCTDYVLLSATIVLDHFLFKKGVSTIAK